MLAGTNHSAHRTYVGFVTQDYDRAGIEIRHCTTIIFPSPYTVEFTVKIFYQL